MAKLQAARIAVCGLGAVGSYAVEALARIGVGYLRLVDFDEVRESNLNRQLYALESTIGQKKAKLAGARVLDINSDCEAEILDMFVDRENLPTVLAQPLDLVIDSMDSLGPKVDLITAAVEAGLPIISSMGAATRTDPFAIRAGDLFETSGCPLARLVRKRLRRRGIKKGVLCVYSAEESTVQKVTRPEPKEQSFERGRPRAPLGSLSYATGMFGLIAASEAVKLLIAKK